MQGFSLVEMWNSMGWLARGLSIFMILMGVYSLGVIAERLIAYSTGSKQSYQFVLALREYLHKTQIDDAIAAAKKHPKSPIAKMMAAGMTEYQAGLKALKEKGPDDVGDFDIVDAINRALERVKERETTGLRRGLGGLATIASAAPFVGLLGTVIGIINAFAKLKGGGGMDVVGPGVSEALVNTAVGLFVAIPAAMFFNYFAGRVENFVVDMNDVSSEFIDYVLKEGRAR